MEETAAVLHTDLVGVIWTLVGGFLSLIASVATFGYWIGRKATVHRTDHENLHTKVDKVATDLKDHNDACNVDREERKEWERGIEERLGDGSTRFALVEQGQKDTKDALARIESKLDRRE